MLARIRIALWALVGVAALAGIWLAMQKPRPAPPSADNQMPVQSIGGPFILTGSDGKPFDSRSLEGKPYAIFFGFTHCPDVCPTTLSRLVKLRRQLGKGDDALRILFVTVDPDRDGPAEVGAYSALFATPIIGLTGTPASIDKVKKQFGIFSEKVGQGENYSINHTATVFLIDSKGGFVSTISPEEKDDVASEKIKRVVA
ncbi:SCO family protein [Sphingomonas jaspsi]|uniref:SCO family protein n=1 Tax=Sphingomonas jaspsi TaxID=392409 RepID=UPI0004B962CE|nr:SCO family protein [Sphingomonas jaspsi]